MKHRIYLLLISLMVVGCLDKKNSNIENSSLSSQDTLYDISRGELVHETEDTLWFEPYEKKVLKIRNIFKEGKVYVYEATYRNSNEEVLSNNRIQLLCSGQRIGFAPEMQDRITFVYENYKEDSMRLSNHFLNIEYQRWENEAYEGIIENTERVWIHPMRQNQYKFTEVAPFPDVQLPLEIGNEWEANLNINNYFGEWANTSGVSEYKVIKKDTFTLNNRNIDCWEIESKSIFPFGVTKLNYKFNENYGFVEMNYRNYENESLRIKMIEAK